MNEKNTEEKIQKNINFRRYAGMGVGLLLLIGLVVGGYFGLKKFLQDRQRALLFRESSAFTQRRIFKDGKEVQVYDSRDGKNSKKNPNNPTMPYVPPPQPNNADAAIQRTLRTIDEINRINQMNQKLMDEQQRMQNRK